MKLNLRFSAALASVPPEKLVRLEAPALSTFTMLKDEIMDLPLPDRIVVGRVDGTLGSTLYLWEGTEDQAVAVVSALV